MIDYIKRNKVILGITVFTVALLYYFVSAEKSDWKIKDVEATAEEATVEEATAEELPSSFVGAPKNENLAIIKNVPVIEAVPVKLGEAKAGVNTTTSVVAEENSEVGEPQGVASGCGESISGELKTAKTEKADSVVKTTEQPATVKSAVSMTTEDK